MIEIKVNIEKLISEFLYFYLTSNIGLSEGESIVGVKIFKDTSNELEVLWKDTKF